MRKARPSPLDAVCLQRFNVVLGLYYITLSAIEATARCIVIVFVCPSSCLSGCMCLSLCCHDNSTNMYRSLPNEVFGSGSDLQPSEFVRSWDLYCRCKQNLQNGEQEVQSSRGREDIKL